MSKNGQTYDSMRDNLPLKVMALERDVAALDARCRECSSTTKSMLRSLSVDLGRFAAWVVSDVLKINKRIDALIGNGKKKNGRA